ncbi:MAG: hypothetical protein HY320_11530 [Armatimonadetes bacterium]|nr:hypothetical protein [Armatimonadota bacterium]
MFTSDRQRHIDALVERYRRLLEQCWPDNKATLDQIEPAVEELGQEMERVLGRIWQL